MRHDTYLILARHIVVEIDQVSALMMNMEKFDLKLSKNADTLPHPRLVLINPNEGQTTLRH